MDKMEEAYNATHWIRPWGRKKCSGPTWLMALPVITTSGCRYHLTASWQLFQGSDNNDLLERVLAYIKTQTENPKFPESGFSLDKIMHLYINFHRLVLTQRSSCTELPEWIQNKKAVINPQNKDEEYFKWAVIGVLHYEEIPPRWNPPWRGEGAYQTKRFSPQCIKKWSSLERCGYVW